MSVKQAADILNNDGLVVMPTETVYGLAAKANSDKAIEKIYQIKARPKKNPLIIHVNNIEMANDIILFGDNAVKIANIFCPGSISFVGKRRFQDNRQANHINNDYAEFQKDIGKAKKYDISDYATAGLDSLAVRIPEHEIPQQIISELQYPVVAPSANLSGYLSPTAIEHISSEIYNNVELVLDGGECKSGVESTIIDIRDDDNIIILRDGVIDADLIYKHTNIKVLPRNAFSKNGDNEKQPLSPGALLKHYAPKNTRIRLDADLSSLQENEAFIAFGKIDDELLKNCAKNFTGDIINLSEKGDLLEACHNLFSALHKFDSKKYSAIAIMTIPNIGAGIAINDRLHRAASAK